MSSVHRLHPCRCWIGSIVLVLCIAHLLAGCRPISAPAQPSLVDQRLHLADLTRTIAADFEALAIDEALWVDDTWRRETVAALREAAALANTLAADSSYQRDILIARGAAFAWAADSVEAFDLAGLSAAATMLAEAVPPPPTATHLPPQKATPVPTQPPTAMRSGSNPASSRCGSAWRRWRMTPLCWTTTPGVGKRRASHARHGRQSCSMPRLRRPSSRRG